MQNSARHEDDLVANLRIDQGWGSAQLMGALHQVWPAYNSFGTTPESEVGWAVGLKYTDGFTRPLPTLLTVAAMIVSLGLLGLAMKELPLGTAYAIWTGVGAVGTVIAGIILFGESMALIRLASVALIVCGLLGLKLSH